MKIRAAKAALEAETGAAAAEKAPAEEASKEQRRAMAARSQTSR